MLLVRDLLADAPGEAIRFALLGAHYRQPLDWSAAGLTQAKKSLDRLYGLVRDLEHVPNAASSVELINPFVAALEDDLNFPKAIAELFNIAKVARRASAESDAAAAKAALLEAGQLVGLLQQSPEDWFFGRWYANAEDEEIQVLVDARREARQAGDYSAADRIRAELSTLGLR